AGLHRRGRAGRAAPQRRGARGRALVHPRGGGRRTRRTHARTGPAALAAAVDLALAGRILAPGRRGVSADAAARRPGFAGHRRGPWNGPMFATRLAVVVALVLGHLARELPALLRHYGWFEGWLDWLRARLGEGGVLAGRWGLVLALGPPLLLVALLQWLLDGVLFGLPGLLFAVAVLFHAWGPRDLDRDVEDVVEAPDGDGRRAAAAALWPEGRRDQASL